MTGLQILTGDCRAILPTLEAGSVQMCCTSPPYWGLRSYLPDGHEDKTSELGLESSPEEYIEKMVAVFREVWRVLRDDGTLWLNLGDSYANGGNQTTGYNEPDWIKTGGACNGGVRTKVGKTGLKPKDLCMMPARLAMALQADGWYLRSEIVWAKPNPMPESVTDRPTKAHEMIYLLTKNGGNPLIWRARDTGEWSYSPDLSEILTTREDLIKIQAGWDYSHRDGGSTDGVPRWKGFDYFYDAEAIREPASDNPITLARNNRSDKGIVGAMDLHGSRWGQSGNGGYERKGIQNRNKRSVWTIATQPYAEAHFATFPEEIPKLCILAGSKPGDTVLDPFAGSGTVGQVALELGRRAVLIELNPAYIELVQDRTLVTPGFF